MRRILLALIALGCSVPAAEAARRDEGRAEAASRPAQASRQQAPATRAAPRAEVQRGDVRTSRSGVAVRGSAAARVPGDAVSRDAANACTPRSGRAGCAPARSGIAGWQTGLPRVDYAQRDCPEGTFATLARGHDDVVRCMPM